MNPLATVAAIHAARSAAAFIFANLEAGHQPTADAAWEFWLDDDSQSGAEHVAFRTAEEQALIRAAFVEVYEAEVAKWTPPVAPATPLLAHRSGLSLNMTITIGAVDLYGFQGRERHPETEDAGQVARVLQVTHVEEERAEGYDVYLVQVADGRVLEIIEHEVEFVSIGGHDFSATGERLSMVRPGVR